MKTKTFLAMAMALSVSISAQAHRLWILPAATVLSGDDPWVTLDAAVSNDIFYFNHFPLNTDNISVLGPNGKTVEIQNAHAGKHRSTFDLQLKDEGTYKVVVASHGMNASWEDEDGKRHRWPGRGEQPTPEGFEKDVPKKAKDLKVAESSRRLETFITSGAPSEQVLKLTNVGLEMKPLVHPNDLFSGEQAQFQFLIDGKPAVGTEVTVIRGGTRYRNAQAELKLVADKKGMIEISWSEAGMYWLEAEYSDDQAKAPATTRRGSYIATLEVLPE
ncbi:DUF4198 domain-containing protein [Pseudomaricurvus sp.]|uniref:DUF4198 domain-containing protein n=1 Tax=Pseudomaricurvus sp. TaxID=2004510 RepID=UPI003F6D6BD1